MPGQSQTISGKVISANDIGIKLEGYDNWFNYTKQHDVDHAQKGQTVSIKVSGDWINALELTNGSRPVGQHEPIGNDDRQRSIVRQSSLKAAVEFYGLLNVEHANECGKASDHVLQLAEKFCEWVNRDTEG